MDAKERYWADPERYRATSRRWYYAHLEEARARSAKWHLEHPDSVRRHKKHGNLKRAYGLTLEEYSALLEAQGGVCAICKRAEYRRTRLGGTATLAVDHDHQTNKVRGLLCTSCNARLGVIETTEFVAAALAYLQRTGEVL